MPTSIFRRALLAASAAAAGVSSLMVLMVVLQWFWRTGLTEGSVKA